MDSGKTCNGRSADFDNKGLNSPDRSFALWSVLEYFWSFTRYLQVFPGRELSSKYLYFAKFKFIIVPNNPSYFVSRVKRGSNLIRLPGPTTGLIYSGKYMVGFRGLKSIFLSLTKGLMSSNKVIIEWVISRCLECTSLGVKAELWEIWWW